MNLISWLRDRLKTGNRWFDSVIVVASMPDVPEDPRRDVYAVGEKRHKWLVFACPCGCGDTIHVNLMTSRWPYWLHEIQVGQISLFPSLWRPKGTCGSHFWVVDSAVHWARTFPEDFEWPIEADVFFERDTEW
jgi:hypothetical protein